MRRLGAALVAAVAVAAIVVAGLGAFGSASRAAPAPRAAASPAHRAHAAPARARAPTIRPHSGSCYVAAGCSAIPCTQFIDSRPVDRCATVGDRALRGRQLFVEDGVLHAATAAAATRSR